MSSFDPPIGTTYPFAPAEALGEVATAHYAPPAFERGGPLGRAVRLVEQGLAPAEAAAVAAKQGKGHLAEVIQSARFGANSGVTRGRFRARPNPVPNDPVNDVHVLRGRRRVGGAQVKMGSRAYVLRSLKKGAYGTTIVNAEVFAGLEQDGYADVYDVTDRLDHGGTEAVPLRAEDCEREAASLLTRVLIGDPTVSQLDLLLQAGKAGFRDGAVNAALTFVGQLVYSVWRGERFDVSDGLRRAVQSSGRAFIRTTIQTRALMEQFVSKARHAFSDRLIHRVARSSLVVGAFAEVVVEVASDLIRVLRRELTFEDLLRRLGVHVVTAAGGVAGASLAAALVRGGPWWLQAIAMLVGGLLGAQSGRRLGQAVFMPPALPAPIPIRAT
jgi:hypothetical protein